MNEPLKVRHRLSSEERRRLLEEFSMITLDDLAILLGVDRRTLQNRSPQDLPPFTRAGKERLFFKADVEKFMRGRMSL